MPRRRVAEGHRRHGTALGAVDECRDVGVGHIEVQRDAVGRRGIADDAEAEIVEIVGVGQVETAPGLGARDDAKVGRLDKAVVPIAHGRVRGGDVGRDGVAAEVLVGGRVEDVGGLEEGRLPPLLLEGAPELGGLELDLRRDGVLHGELRRRVEVERGVHGPLDLAGARDGGGSQQERRLDAEGDLALRLEPELRRGRFHPAIARADGRSHLADEDELELGGRPELHPRADGAQEVLVSLLEGQLEQEQCRALAVLHHEVGIDVERLVDRLEDDLYSLRGVLPQPLLPCGCHPRLEDVVDQFAALAVREVLVAILPHLPEVVEQEFLLLAPGGDEQRGGHGQVEEGEVEELHAHVRPGHDMLGLALQVEVEADLGADPLAEAGPGEDGGGRGHGEGAIRGDHVEPRALVGGAVVVPLDGRVDVGVARVELGADPVGRLEGHEVVAGPGQFRVVLPQHVGQRRDVVLELAHVVVEDVVVGGAAVVDDDRLVADLDFHFGDLVGVVGQHAQGEGVVEPRVLDVAAEDVGGVVAIEARRELAELHLHGRVVVGLVELGDLVGRIEVQNVPLIAGRQTRLHRQRDAVAARGAVGGLREGPAPHRHGVGRVLEVGHRCDVEPHGDGHVGDLARHDVLHVELRELELAVGAGGLGAVDQGLGDEVGRGFGARGDARGPGDERRGVRPRGLGAEPRAWEHDGVEGEPRVRLGVVVERLGKLLAALAPLVVVLGHRDEVRDVVADDLARAAEGGEDELVVWPHDDLVGPAPGQLLGRAQQHRLRPEGVADHREVAPVAVVGVAGRVVGAVERAVERGEGVAEVLGERDRFDVVHVEVVARVPAALEHEVHVLVEERDEEAHGLEAHVDLEVVAGLAEELAELDRAREVHPHVGGNPQLVDVDEGEAPEVAAPHGDGHVVAVRPRGHAEGLVADLHGREGQRALGLVGQGQLGAEEPAILHPRVAAVPVGLAGARDDQVVAFELSVALGHVDARQARERRSVVDLVHRHVGGRARVAQGRELVDPRPGAVGGVALVAVGVHGEEPRLGARAEIDALDAVGPRVRRVGHQVDLLHRHRVDDGDRALGRVGDEGEQAVGPHRDVRRALADRDGIGQEGRDAALGRRVDDGHRAVGHVHDPDDVGWRHRDLLLEAREPLVLGPRRLPRLMHLARHGPPHLHPGRPEGDTVGHRHLDHPALGVRRRGEHHLGVREAPELRPQLVLLVREGHFELARVRAEVHSLEHEHRLHAARAGGADQRHARDERRHIARDRRLEVNLVVGRAAQHRHLAARAARRLRRADLHRDRLAGLGGHRDLAAGRRPVVGRQPSDDGRRGARHERQIGVVDEARHHEERLAGGRDRLGRGIRVGHVDEGVREGTGRRRDDSIGACGPDAAVGRRDAARHAVGADDGSIHHLPGVRNRPGACGNLGHPYHEQLVAGRRAARRRQGEGQRILRTREVEGEVERCEVGQPDGQGEGQVPLRHGNDGHRLAVERLGRDVEGDAAGSRDDATVAVDVRAARAGRCDGEQNLLTHGAPDDGDDRLALGDGSDEAVGRDGDDGLVARRVGRARSRRGEVDHRAVGLPLDEVELPRVAGPQRRGIRRDVVDRRRLGVTDGDRSSRVEAAPRGDDCGHPVGLCPHAPCVGGHGDRLVERLPLGEAAGQREGAAVGESPIEPQPGGLARLELELPLALAEQQAGKGRVDHRHGHRRGCRAGRAVVGRHVEAGRPRVAGLGQEEGRVAVAREGDAAVLHARHDEAEGRAVGVVGERREIDAHRDVGIGRGRAGRRGRRAVGHEGEAGVEVLAVGRVDGAVAVGIGGEVVGGLAAGRAEGRVEEGAVVAVHVGIAVDVAGEEQLDREVTGRAARAGHLDDVGPAAVEGEEGEAAARLDGDLVARHARDRRRRGVEAAAAGHLDAEGDPPARRRRQLLGCQHHGQPRRLARREAAVRPSSNGVAEGAEHLVDGLRAQQLAARAVVDGHAYLPRGRQHRRHVMGPRVVVAVPGALGRAEIAHAGKVARRIVVVCHAAAVGSGERRQAALAVPLEADALAARRDEAAVRPDQIEAPGRDDLRQAVVGVDGVAGAVGRREGVVGAAEATAGRVVGQARVPLGVALGGQLEHSVGARELPRAAAIGCPRRREPHYAALLVPRRREGEARPLPIGQGQVEPRAVAEGAVDAHPLLARGRHIRRELRVGHGQPPAVAEGALHVGRKAAVDAVDVDPHAVELHREVGGRGLEGAELRGRAHLDQAVHRRRAAADVAGREPQDVGAVGQALRIEGGQHPVVDGRDVRGERRPIVGAQGRQRKGVAVEVGVGHARDDVGREGEDGALLRPVDDHGRRGRVGHVADLEVRGGGADVAIDVGRRGRDGDVAWAARGVPGSPKAVED